MWTKFNGVEGQIFPPKMASYVAVKLYGPGHVVAYNYIADFHDGINVETYGNPDGSFASGPDIIDGPKYPTREYWDRRPVAIDFYNNYITNSHDNPIEADGSMHNIRIMRNMLINHASHAFCNQPTLGGPVYWIRNIAYNLPGGSTRLTNGVGGRALLQQHDPLGDAGRGGVEHPLAQQPDARAELGAGDLQRQHVHELHVVGLQRLPCEPGSGDGVRVECAAAAGVARISPGRDTTASPRDAARSRRWRNTPRPPARTVTACAVDYDVFVNVRRLDAQDASSVQKLYKADEFDFRLKPRSAGVDKGALLPNVTDGFAGRAPDLGALELGQPVPHYGPRN